MHELSMCTIALQVQQLLVLYICGCFCQDVDLKDMQHIGQCNVVTHSHTLPIGQ